MFLRFRMPRNYEAKGLRGNWSLSCLQKAVECVLIEKSSEKSAAKAFGIPRQTLRRHLKKARKGDSVMKVLGRPRILSEQQEKELFEVIIDMENRLFGLTKMDVRRLTYSYCEINKIHHNFNSQTKCAGEDWMIGFMKNHPQLSLRKPEPTSIARAAGFNKEKVNRFFDVLESILYGENSAIVIPPSRIFNADESGFSVCHSPGKVIARKGKRSVGAVTSLEKGKTITALCCMNATGMFVPPMFIFPRVRMKPSFIDSAPSGSLGVATKSGWINEELFTEWFDHFVSVTQPRNCSSPTLLIVDGHCSHVKNLSVVLKARENNVIILSLPSHCTHRLQPLDVSFFKALNSRYNNIVQTWHRQHPGRSLTEAEFGALFREAYGDAASVKKAESGFRKTGIYPFNRYIFSDEDFLAAAATERELQGEPIPHQEPLTAEPQDKQRIESLSSDLPELETSMNSSQLRDEVSKIQQQSGQQHLGKTGSVHENRITEMLQQSEMTESAPKDGIAYELQDCAKAKPSINQESDKSSSLVTQSAIFKGGEEYVAERVHVQFRQLIEQEQDNCPRKSLNPRKKRTVQHATVVTSSPYKTELESSLASKKRKVSSSSQMENERKKTKKHRSITNVPPVSKERKQIRKTSASSSIRNIPVRMNKTVGDYDADCLYCCEMFSVTGGKWIQCTVCKRWAHVECAGVPYMAKFFNCDLCKS